MSTLHRLTQIQHWFGKHKPLKPSQSFLPDHHVWVYFVGEQDGETPIKIGRSSNLTKRFRDLRASSPLQLSVLGAVVCLPEWEDELHAQFAESRRWGEWFDRTPRLMKVIEPARRGDFGGMVNALYEDAEFTAADRIKLAEQVIVICNDGDVKDVSHLLKMSWGTPDFLMQV